MLRFFVRAAVLAAVLYVAWVLGFPFFQYLMMQRAVEEAADIGVAQVVAARKGPWRDEAIGQEVTAKVTDLMRARANRIGLDLPASGVQVLLELDRLRLATAWEVDARLAGYVHRFRFRVEGRRTLTHSGG